MRVSWVDVGDRKRCTIHDETGSRLFGRLEQCAECMRSPIPVQSREMELDEQPAIAPDGCLTAVLRERTLTGIALFAEEVGRELAAPETDANKSHRRNIPAAAKMLDLAIKAHRAAGEYSQTRERRDYVRRLERQVRKLRGGARN